MKTLPDDAPTVAATPTGDGVWIVIAAYNEARVITAVIGDLLRSGYQVAVVDDGSSDATARVAPAPHKPLVWFLGHLTCATDYFSTLHQGTKSLVTEEFSRRYAGNDDQDWSVGPSLTEMIDLYQAVHARMRGFVAGLTPADLESQSPMEPVGDDRLLFEFLVLEGAQAGLSWETILKKREAYRAAFAGFDPAKVARFKSERIARRLRHVEAIHQVVDIGTIADGHALREGGPRRKQADCDHDQEPGRAKSTERTIDSHLLARF